jgi:hypothetical protein
VAEVIQAKTETIDSVVDSSEEVLLLKVCLLCDELLLL